jgi:hypothetical protein
MAAPEDDATGGSQNIKCFVTENGEVNGSAGTADVDGGWTSLASPVFTMEGTDGIISYARWFFDSQSTDHLDTFISNDGGVEWYAVHSTYGTNSEWETTSFVVSEFVQPTDQMQVAFLIEDADPQSIVEGGIDNLQLEIIDCGDSCIGDVNQDGTVNVTDLLSIIDAWGTSDAGADIDGDGVVAVGDLLTTVGNWGSCEP